LARDEQVLIVDRENRPVGVAPRWEMRAGGLPHRATYILIFNATGELHVQRRTMTKDVYPGYLDPAAGGVVLAGESYEESAERELAEEMGIRGVPLAAGFDFWFDEAPVRVWGRVFVCGYDGPLVLQAEEVESICFLTPEAVLACGERVTPDGLAVVRRYLAG
jgi:8-oxo-dGTP pyrophosphatase MutT (NUDIX family)